MEWSAFKAGVSGYKLYNETIILSKFNVVSNNFTDMPHPVSFVTQFYENVQLVSNIEGDQPEYFDFDENLDPYEQTVPYLDRIKDEWLNWQLIKNYWIYAFCARFDFQIENSY